MATVRTGASAYVKYGYEATYGGSGTANKSFGLQDRVTNWTLTNNRIDLAKLNQVEIENYAYGRQQGSISMGFVLSNPWIFQSIYGPPSTAGGSDPYTHTFPHATNGQPKAIAGNSLKIELGYDGSDQNIIRTLKGGVVNSLGISTSINDTVGCNCDITYGHEEAPDTSTTLAPPTLPSVEFPYTFAHGTIKVGGSTLAEVQDADITFAQNTNLLYQIGQHHAKDAYRQIFDITGRFRAAMLNKDMLENVLNQVKKGTAGTYAEVVAGSPAFELTFTRSATEYIKLTGVGLAPTDISIQGIEPVEPIFEEITWRVKSCTIECKNAEGGAE